MTGAAPRRLLVASHNAGKIDEMRQLLAEAGIEVVSAADLGLAEPAETGTTFVENARLKARAAVKAAGITALADDSGLTVDVLGGAPGVATADWAAGPGGGRDYGPAMARVIDAARARQASEPWLAQFRATLVLRRPDGVERVVEGVCPGRLVWPPRGEGGHGFDPIFVPDFEARTFAEMPTADKNALSHRAGALRALLALLEAEPDLL